MRRGAQGSQQQISILRTEDHQYFDGEQPVGPSRIGHSIVHSRTPFLDWKHPTPTGSRCGWQSALRQSRVASLISQEATAEEELTGYPLLMVRYVDELIVGFSVWLSLILTVKVFPNVQRSITWSPFATCSLLNDPDKSVWSTGSPRI